MSCSYIGTPNGVFFIPNDFTNASMILKEREREREREREIEIERDR